MKIIKTMLFTFLLAAMFSLTSFSQGVVKGKIIDKTLNEPLIGATAFLQENNTIGATSDLDGSFIINVPNGNFNLEISFIGFEDMVFPLNLNDGEIKDLGTINLVSTSIGLDEVQVISSIAVDRKTPVAVSTVDARMIETELGHQELPEILKFTPSVYATKSGGGFGDSRINIRGFNQRNVAVLINGIPVNDMENGWVYWSNWAGLGDATRTIQVQRGLGASKLAINSVGGTMNIITKTTDAQKGGSLSYSITDYGNQKAMLSLSTGLMDNDWAVSFVGSRTEGPGYIDQSYVDAWSYYLSMTKVLNKNHTLVFTAIGAPQKHGQRRDRLTPEQYEKYGSLYNPNWGDRFGSVQNQRENYYHKPQIALNWYYQIDNKTLLSTSAYVSIGNGGGSGPLSTKSWDADSVRNKNYDLYNNDGQLDYTGMVNENATHNDALFDPTELLPGENNVYGGFSKYTLRNSVNNHKWYGVLSTLTHNLNDHFKLTAGIDGRMYKGEHYREVKDLLGGDYYYESYGYAVDGAAGRDQYLHPGDRIAYDNDGHVNYGGLFGQIEYTNGRLSAFASGTVSNTWYKRVDRYNYIGEENGGTSQTSPVVDKLAYNMKVGANFNINEHHNVFFNTGYYTRAPFFSFVFVNYKNDIALDLENEKITAFELGYGANYKYFNAKINGYYTIWDDKSLLSRSFTDPESGNDTRAYIKGLSALHKGVEIELASQVQKNVVVSLLGSLGDWRWTNNVNSVVVDDETLDTLANINVYAENLKVADAPQTQIGARVDWNIGKVRTSLQYIYYDHLYAEFDPAGRNEIEDVGVQPYKLPSYGLLDWNIGSDFNIGNVKAYAGMNVNNILDVEYMTEGLDGPNHTYEDVKGWWGFQRTFTFTTKIYF